MIPAAGRRLALAAALLGWLFDGLEMGLFPLVARPALGELLPSATPDAVGRWYAAITALFLVGAATGGVLFGWLGDRAGRVRALTLSVLVYAGCSGLSAFTTSAAQLAGLRFVGALGMGGEWALGVALVMELWPDAARARLAAAIGAAGNLGYALVGTLAFALNRVAPELPGLLATLGLPDGPARALTANGNWRLLMLAGTAPALLTLLIRLAVPESPKWLAARSHQNPAAARDLLAILAGAALALGVVALWFFETPLIARLPLTILGLIGVTICYLAPARRALQLHPSPTPVIPRMLLGAGLSAVPLLATWAGIMWMYTWVGELPGGTHPDARPLLQITSSVGAAAGSALGAALAARLGRRPVYAALCVISCLTLAGFYRLNDRFDAAFLAWSFAVGGTCASFYGWLPLTLPELFPTRLRATGQGFAFNFGRVAAAVGTLQTGALLAHFDNDYARACSLIALVYVAGLVLICMTPRAGRLD